MCAPAIGLAEVEGFERAVRSHAGFREAMRRRGIDDLDLVIDPIPTGTSGRPRSPPGAARVRMLVFVRPSAAATLRATDRGRLRARRPRLRRDGAHRGSRHGAVAGRGGRVPRRARRPARRRRGRSRSRSPRARASPSTATRSAGRSGRCASASIREGLVLHTSATGRRRVRPILHRASIAEMVVPYGDPSPMHYRKNAFDVGECGLGTMANSLTLGCDCLGVIHYFDARARRRAGRARHDQERDLHARGGLRHPLEAHRLPHRRHVEVPPVAAAGRLASRRSATTSTASSGTSTRTARSSSRSSSPASCSPMAVTPGEQPRSAT